LFKYYSQQPLGGAKAVVETSHINEVNRLVWYQYDSIKVQKTQKSSTQLMSLDLDLEGLWKPLLGQVK